jgi:hypothetical protein
MQAIDTVGASPEARAQLASTWTQEISGYGTAQKGANLLMKIEGVFWPTDEFDSLGTWFKPFNGIADMQDMRLRRAVFDFTSQYTGWSMDIQFGTVANLQARLVSLESQRRGYENAAFGAEAEEAQMERQRNRYDQSAEAYTIAADNLTSVDLEATSSQLRQAESRQQLALKTIKVAISAYGNYAGGLLGNVQRTQRALVG